MSRPEKLAKQIPAKTREAVEGRSGGVCESCGIAPAVNVHHRQYLSRGGTHAIHNLLHLCGLGNASGCHGAAHSGGEATGLSVWSWSYPEWWPVLRRGVWVLLLDQPDSHGSWVTEITESTADLLMNRTDGN